MAKKQLGVIFGSRTCEHEVSIISGVPSWHRAADTRKIRRVCPFISPGRQLVYRREAAGRAHAYTPFDPDAKGLTRVNARPDQRLAVR